MFNRMHSYSIHTKDGVDAPELVPEGFSFFAFLFGAFWALYHRLWLFAAALFAVNLASYVLMYNGILSHESYSVVQFMVSIFAGIIAGDARRFGLKHRGYREADLIISENQTKAAQQFLDGHSVA